MGLRIWVEGGSGCPGLKEFLKITFAEPLIKGHSESVKALICRNCQVFIMWPRAYGSGA